MMRSASIAVAGMAMWAFFALSVSNVNADGTDPVQVGPDEPTIHAGGRRAIVTVTSATLPPRGTRASVIAYAPDGTMLKRPRRRLLRNGSTKFALPLGESPQIGTYTVHATVESGSQAFGMPTTFTVVPD